MMNLNVKDSADVLIAGAGPAGSLAAALLRKQGLSVLVLEKERFPRFCIGESLLPQSLGLLEEAGLVEAVAAAGFQHKNGAAFAKGKRHAEFDFGDKVSPGWGTAYQVQRAVFDQILADGATHMGAEIRYGHEITSIDVSGAPRVGVSGPGGRRYEASGRFLLDASGFGRVLPRLLKLERPSDFPPRRAVFTHLEDRIQPGAFDRDKILVAIHPRAAGVWFWLIPFSDGRSSLGVVAETAFLEKYGSDPGHALRALQAEDEEGLGPLLADAVWDTPVRQLTGYACDVATLHGNNFALLGNAGEFLDPVFSSGVTIAFKSASLAAPLVARQLRGETADWERGFAQPLREGVNVFRAFVESWYRGGFQDVLFYENQDVGTRRMICSILAGYAWDTSNPFVREPARLKVLERFCAA